jgi:hypothetical protein
MATTEQVFHVVCRDCDVESLVDSETAAEALADTHGSESDHTVEFGRVM